MCYISILHFIRLTCAKDEDSKKSEGDGIRNLTSLLTKLKDQENTPIDRGMLEFREKLLDSGIDRRESWDYFASAKNYSKRGCLDISVFPYLRNSYLEKVILLG